MPVLLCFKICKQCRLKSNRTYFMDKAYLTLIRLYSLAIYLLFYIFVGFIFVLFFFPLKHSSGYSEINLCLLRLKGCATVPS